MRNIFRSEFNDINGAGRYYTSREEWLQEAQDSIKVSVTSIGTLVRRANIGSNAQQAVNSAVKDTIKTLDSPIQKASYLNQEVNEQCLGANSLNCISDTIKQNFFDDADNN